MITWRSQIYTHAICPQCLGRGCLEDGHSFYGYRDGKPVAECTPASDCPTCKGKGKVKIISEE